MVRAVLAGIGVVTPPPMIQQDLWDGYFKGHTGGSARAERVFANSGVHTRHGVVNPLIEDVSEWSTGRRMRRYEEEALPLGKEALTRALADSGVEATDLGLLVVVSCTGYVTPGLDIRLAAALSASADMQRLVVGHMGCYAAIPALRTAADYVAANGRPAALLCVELTSLHLQPATDVLEQAVAHSLFSDAAAAAVLVPGGPGLAVRNVASRTDTAHADDMTWHVTDQGFRMGLASRVPLVLARHAADAVRALVEPAGRDLTDHRAYAVHPGGPRILDVVGRALGLSATGLDASRSTLAEHGNCSSATVLMVIDRLRRDNPEVDDIVAMSFGPGLTLYSALLASG